MKVEIPKRMKDIIQKYTSSLFREATLGFYGINTARVKEMINVEFQEVKISESSSDIVFLLEDDTYLLIEFQSSYNKRDLIRFADYGLRLYERDDRNIQLVIIYTPNVKEAPAELDIGMITIKANIVMMANYDGNEIFKSLDKKLRNGQDLTDTDMLNLIFLPLMEHSIPRDELAVNSVKMAQSIPDKTKRDTCLAAIVAFTGQYLEKDKFEKLLEVIKMSDLAVMLVEDAVKGVAKDRDIEIAKKMLKGKTVSIEYIAEITDLDVSVIKALQSEIEKESA